jgi:hypothetical protein
MPINNPPGEAHRELLKEHAAELQHEETVVLTKLAETFGEGNFHIEPEGDVICRETDEELGLEKTKVKMEAEEALKRIYTQRDSIKRSDPNAWRETAVH